MQCGENTSHQFSFKVMFFIAADPLSAALFRLLAEDITEDRVRLTTFRK